MTEWMGLGYMSLSSFQQEDPQTPYHQRIFGCLTPAGSPLWIGQRCPHSVGTPRSNIQGGCRSSVCAAGTQGDWSWGWSQAAGLDNRPTLELTWQLPQSGPSWERASPIPAGLPAPLGLSTSVCAPQRTAGEAGDRWEGISTAPNQTQVWPQVRGDALWESRPCIIMMGLHLASERSVL